MKKPAIPQVPFDNTPRNNFDNAVKENIEIITGRRGSQITALRKEATLDDIINKINELLARLQQ